MAKRNTEERFRQAREYVTSGRSINAACEAVGMAPATYHSWLERTESNGVVDATRETARTERTARQERTDAWNESDTRELINSNMSSNVIVGVLRQFYR
jgi:transposase-like protein